MLCGGKAGGGAGWFYPPTVVADLNPEMRMYAEEVFGPVAGLYRVSSYSRGHRGGQLDPVRAGFERLDQRPGRAGRVRTDLHAGAVFINGMTTSYPQLPFGGIGVSGYGRELSADGIREFCNIKTVWVG